MRLLRPLKVMAVSGIALAVAVTAEVSQAVAEGFLVAEENQMTELVNAHRAEHGLPSLRHDAALQMVARRQSSRMVAAGYIYHNPDLAKEGAEAVPDWLKLGENVGVGGSVGSIEDAFLASPMHHANIHHNDFRVIGLGAVPSSDGVLYVTQNFAQQRGASAPAPGAPGAAPGATTAAQNGVVAACQRRGRSRSACRRVVRRARRTTRVRGIVILRPDATDTGSDVTYVRTVAGVAGRIGDQLSWWN